MKELVYCQDINYKSWTLTHFYVLLLPFMYQEIRHQTDCCSGGWSNSSLNSKVLGLRCIRILLFACLVCVGNLSMEGQMKELRLLGESSGLMGSELLEFVQAERTKLQKIGRDERAQNLELKKQDMDNLQAQIMLEKLKHEKVSHDEGSHNATGQKSNARAPKLPHFDDVRDDLDAYLQRFERYAQSQAWKESDWVTNLSALLKGKALDVYSRLSPEDSADYGKLKDALLKRFHLNEHGFMLKFRSARPEKDESAPQFAVRLDNLITRWVDMAKTEKTYDALKDLLLREQFLNCCNEPLSLFLKERKPTKVSEMAHFAEQYSDAHGGFGALPFGGQKPVQTRYQSKPPADYRQGRGAGQIQASKTTSRT